MKRRDFLLGTAGLILAGCGSTWKVDYEQGITPEVSRNWRATGVRIAIPDDLTVSEANVIAPNADIVWHGEERGDRREQVRAIMKEGISQGARGLRGSRPVIIAVQLQQFHAVTPRAVDVAPSAVHNIKYYMQVLDARSGQPLTAPQLVSADLDANVGNAAVIAAMRGDTQRVRIVRHLAAVTAGWLGTGPDQRRTFETLGR